MFVVPGNEGEVDAQEVVKMLRLEVSRACAVRVIMCVCACVYACVSVCVCLMCGWSCCCVSVYFPRKQHHWLWLKIKCILASNRLKATVDAF